MRAPTAFRVQVDKIGQRVLTGDASKEAAVDLLVWWAFANATDLVRAVFREWATARLTDWLKARSSETADQSPGEQMILGLFGAVPMRIEVGPTRFVNLLDANRGQLQAWRKQARVKADNVSGYAERVDKAVDWLVPQLTDDQMTVQVALASVTEGPSL